MTVSRLCHFNLTFSNFVNLSHMKIKLWLALRNKILHKNTWRHSSTTKTLITYPTYSSPNSMNRSAKYLCTHKPLRCVTNPYEHHSTWVWSPTRLEAAGCWGKKNQNLFLSSQYVDKPDAPTDRTLNFKPLDMESWARSRFFVWIPVLVYISLRWCFVCSIL